MSTQWNLQDAKNKFSEVVSAAVAGQPQFVTKRGKPAVVVMSQNDYDLLKKGLKQKPTLPDLLMAMPHSDHDADFEKEMFGESLALKMREVEF